MNNFKFNKSPFNRKEKKKKDKILGSGLPLFNRVRFNRGSISVHYESEKKSLKSPFNRMCFNRQDHLIKSSKDIETIEKEISFSFNAKSKISLSIDVIQVDEIIEEISLSFKAKADIKLPVDVEHSKSLSFKSKLKMNAETYVYRDPELGRYINILDFELNEVDKIRKIIQPSIYEEINASYNFRFSTIINDVLKYFNDDYLIEVDDDYFIFQRVVKQRDSSISVQVDCEHVSYLLNDEDDYTEEYETDARTMLSSVLAKTPFRVGSVEFSDDGIEYYRSSETNVKRRLIDIANLFGGELVYDRFTIHLVKQRQSTDEVHQFKLGENLIGVTEEVDYTSGYKRKSYEVDVLDLSHLPEYEFLKAIGLGDTVVVEDEQLNIFTTERIVSREYDPFQKVNPMVQIGNVLRNFTEYEKDETEKELPELDLANFEIGGINCLSLSGVDVTEQELERMKDGTDYEPSATIECFGLESLKGLFVKGVNEYFGIRVREINENGVIDYKYKVLESLKEKMFPSTENSIIQVIISYENIDSLHENSRFKVFAIRFVKKPFDGEHLARFRIGTVNALSLMSVDITHSGTPSAIIEHTGLETIEGLFITKHNDISSYHLKVEEIGDNGSNIIYSGSDHEYISNGFFPRQENSVLIVTVSNDEEITDDTDYKVYGIEFVYVEEDDGHKSGNYYMEHGNTQISKSTILFMFEHEYDEVTSVTTGIIGMSSNDVPIKLEKITKNGKYTGVQITTDQTRPNVYISIQAIGYKRNDG